MKIQDEILQKIKYEIDTCMHTNRDYSKGTFELDVQPFLLSNLSGWIGALVIRTLLYKLNIDEEKVFKWRLDNKYMQYLIFNHYVRGCMPKTLGLSVLLERENWVPQMRYLFKHRFFIKATLGYGSGRTNSFDRTTEIEEILSTHQHELCINEKWILQKRIEIAAEFRVHSFGKNVVYGLTFTIQRANFPNRSSDAEAFVRSILEKMPDSILSGTLIGWDIAVTPKGKFYIIEANFTGLHPVFKAGFQTSGYFDDPIFGSIICAWFNLYLRNTCEMSIGSVATSFQEKFPFLDKFQFYLSIFKNEHMRLLGKVGGHAEAVFIYLDEYTDFLMIELIKYLPRTNLADKFYVITLIEYMSTAERLLEENKRLYILAEDTLFTKDQYALIQRLSKERRKYISCYHIIRQFNFKSYLIF